MQDSRFNTRMFQAGLMDWVGDHPPTSDDLIGKAVVDQGAVHIKTITENGGEIIGCRELSLDDLKPEQFFLPTWGFAVIVLVAEDRFGGTPRSA